MAGGSHFVRWQSAFPWSPMVKHHSASYHRFRLFLSTWCTFCKIFLRYVHFHWSSGALTNSFLSHHSYPSGSGRHFGHYVAGRSVHGERSTRGRRWEPDKRFLGQSVTKIADAFLKNLSPFSTILFSIMFMWCSITLWWFSIAMRLGRSHTTLVST